MAWFYDLKAIDAECMAMSIGAEPAADQPQVDARDRQRQHVNG